MNDSIEESSRQHYHFQFHIISPDNKCDARRTYSDFYLETAGFHSMVKNYETLDVFTLITIYSIMFIRALLLHHKGYSMSIKPLADKRVIITGASSGIGAAIAHEYAKAGAHIWSAGGSDLQGLQSTIDACKNLGVNAGGKCYNLSKAQHTSQLICDGVDFLGGLDILVICAGTRAFKPIVEITDDEVDLLFEVNAKAAYIASREAAKVMIPQKSGSILMIGSAAGHRGRADTSLYSVTKSVLHHLTKCLAIELGPHGIRVNCLAPGLVASPRVKARLDAKPEYLQSRLEGIPLHQIGTVENMAATALFMVSPGNEFMNGSIVLSDGGVTAG